MIVVVSLWRNDADRNILCRVKHLLNKYSNKEDVRWLWGVGDCSDDTEKILRAVISPKVEIVNVDTGIAGETLATRRHRLAVSASILFTRIRKTDDLVCLHESDILSPEDVLDRLSSINPTAGWPILNLKDGSVFYDTFAYRHLKGHYFSPKEKKPDQKFQVSSFGTVWMAPASLVQGRILGDDCVVDLCKQWRTEGIELFVDPNVTVVQPTDLWSPC